MLLPLCKFCGERHPLLKCPEFDAVEQAHVLIKEAREQVALGMAKVEGSVVVKQVGVAGLDCPSGDAEQPRAGLRDEVLPAQFEVKGDRGLAAAHATVEHKHFDSPRLAGDLDAFERPVAFKVDGECDHVSPPVALVEHPVPPRERKPHRYIKQDASERSLEPWKALGISRRTYYRRKRNRE
jgi:hypothetical protein